MSKKIKPVNVEIAGKQKQLRFDFNAMVAFEELMGYGLYMALQDGQIGFRTIRAFYWAGLRWKDKGLTPDRVGMMLSDEIADGKDLLELMDPINEALEASGVLGNMDEDDEDEAEDEDEAKNA